MADAHDDLALIRLAADYPGVPVSIIVGPVAASLYEDAQLVGYHADPGPLGYRRDEVSLSMQATGCLDGASVDFRTGRVRHGMSGGPLLIKQRGELSCLGIARLGGLGRGVSVATTGSSVLHFVKSLGSAWSSKIGFRPLLREELEAYLSTVEADGARLSILYPPSLREAAQFDRIRPRMRELKRTEIDAWRAEQPRHERERAAGDAAAFDITRFDWRGRLILPQRADATGAGEIARPAIPSHTFTWDTRADSDDLRQVVILGDPGFGKSWLLRYEGRRKAIECRALLDDANVFSVPEDLPIPVFIRLADLARCNATTFVERLRLHFQERLLDSTFLERCLAEAQRGSLVLLLDAWDEVEGETGAFRDQIEAFAKATGSRIVLSSRTAAYGMSPIPGAREVELLAFERKEIDDFVRVWFDGDERATALLSLLDQHEAVSGLARIPLLLALLCRVFGEGASTKRGVRRLPTRRGALYRQCLWGLVHDWKHVDKKRHHSDDMISGRIDQVARAAEHLFPRDQFTLSELAQSAGFSLHDSSDRHAAQEFVDELKGDGLLVPVGMDPAGQWRFLHRTMYEWLVARALALRVVGLDSRQIARFLDERASDAVWREVIVLLAGELEEPSALLGNLADEASDDLFRPRLALAVRCLPEIAPAVRDRTNVQGQIDKITTAAMDVAFSFYGRDLESGAYSLVESLPSLPGVNGKWGSKRLLDRVALGVAASDDKEYRDGLFCVHLLGRGAATDRIVEVLVARLVEDSEDPNDHSEQSCNGVRASNALMAMGTGVAGTTTERRLIKLLSHSESTHRYNAVRVIESARFRSPATIEALYELLADPMMFILTIAVDALAALAEVATTGRFVKRLESIASKLKKSRGLAKLVAGIHCRKVLDTIYGIKEARPLARPADDARELAVLIGELGRRGADKIAVAQNIRDVCKRDEHYDVRSVSEFRSAIPKVSKFEPILRRAFQHEDPNVRAATIEATGSLRSASAGALERLKRGLHDSSLWVALESARALGKLGSLAATKDVLEVLSKFLSIECCDERAEVTRAIAQMGPAAATPSILAALVRQLADGGIDKSRQPAVWALTNMGEAARTPEMIESLVTLLHHEDWTARAAAAEVLGEFQRNGARVTTTRRRPMVAGQTCE